MPTNEAYPPDWKAVSEYIRFVRAGRLRLA